MIKQFTGQMLILVIMITGVLNAGTKPMKIADIQSLPTGVSIHQLDNGMEVLLIENPALPMVGVNVVIKVGSAYETFATSGMSHMLEHLLFNGTTTRSQKELYGDVDRIGGYNNASTSEYYTNFMMVTPADHIQEGMEIQMDMLFNSTLPDEKFKKEKGIVLEEISKSLAEPGEQLNRNQNSILFKGHALSLPTLGTYSTIESMSRDEVHSFYKNYYVPNNMIMSVVGNFESSDMLETINDIYGKAKPSEVNEPVNTQLHTGFHPLDKNVIDGQQVFHRFYGGSNIKLQLFFPFTEETSSEFNHLLGMVLEERSRDLENLLLLKFGNSVEAASIELNSSPVANFIAVKIIINQKTDYNPIIQSVLSQLTEMKFLLPGEIIDAEITKTKTGFLKNIEKPHMFGIYNSHEFAVSGIERVLASYSGNTYHREADKISRIKINSKPVIIIQSPMQKKDEEAQPDLIAPQLFTDEQTGKQLIVVQNRASNLLAIHYMVKHKAMYESKYGKDASKILHDCLEQRLKSERNQKISSRFGLTYVLNDIPFIPMDDIYLHPDFGYMRVEGLADELKNAIEYINNEIKSFIPTEDEFKNAVQKFNSPMMMGGDKNRELFEEKYESYVYENTPYSQEKPELSYENLLAFTKEYFQPGNMIISVVSPEAPETVNNFFNRFTGYKIENEPDALEKILKIHSEPVNFEKKGRSKRAYMFWGFSREIAEEDKPALKALSLILSDQIVFDIREKQGMAYHMSAGIKTSKNIALFYINQGTRSRNVDKLLPQYPGFFRAGVLDSVTQEDVEKSINMYLGRMMFRRLSSINQAYYLAHSLYFQNDIHYDKTFLDKLKTITLDDIKTVANKYMTVSNPVSVIVR